MVEVKRTVLLHLVVLYMSFTSEVKCEETTNTTTNVATNFTTKESTRDGVTIENPIFHFPFGGPFMGILAAFAVPVDLKGPADVFVAVNFEASYSVPENQTQFVYPPIVGGSTTRQFLYNMIEKKLLSPSTSKNDNLLKGYRDAETSGKKKGCKRFTKDCPYSLLKLVSWVGNMINKV